MRVVYEATLACVMFAAPFTPARAFEIYRYLMPDGTVLYTQEVSTKGKLQEVIESPAPDSKQVEEMRQARLKREKSLDVGVAVSSGNGIDIPDAIDTLNVAKAALAAGVTPRPGERLGIKDSHHTRLSPAYWARQLELRRAVDDAREQLDEAYSALKALN